MSYATFLADTGSIPGARVSTSGTAAKTLHIPPSSRQHVSAAARAHQLTLHPTSRYSATLQEHPDYYAGACIKVTCSSRDTAAWLHAAADELLETRATPLDATGLHQHIRHRLENGPWATSHTSSHPAGPLLATLLGDALGTTSDHITVSIELTDAILQHCHLATLAAAEAALADGEASPG